jgi:hypothetical protein
MFKLSELLRNNSRKVLRNKVLSKGQKFLLPNCELPFVIACM